MQPEIGREPLQDRLLRRIAHERRPVFLGVELADLDGYGQVGRALRRAVRDGEPVRLGYGVHARAKISRLTGQVMLDVPGRVQERRQDRAGETGRGLGLSEAARAYTRVARPGYLSTPWCRSRVALPGGSSTKANN
jgi:hypothetical protein